MAKEEDGTALRRLVITEEEKARVFEECNPTPFSGHAGLDNTLTQIKERFYWPDYYKDTIEMVSYKFYFFVEPGAQSPRGFSALARLYYLARPTKTAMLRRLYTRYPKKCFTQIYRDLYIWRRHAGAHPVEHQRGGRKPTETSVTEFCYKRVNLFFEELISIKVIIFQIHKLFR